MTVKLVRSIKRSKANRQYKSSVFASYFSEKPERLLELYNAFSKVPYPAGTPLEVNTLDSALFYGLINDISFILNNMLIVLIEHQSSVNPNMPFRILLYLAEILKRKHSDPRPFYRSALQKIEKVRCLVLYNGLEDQPDKSILRLSDAYQQIADDLGDPELDIQLELVVPVYNINQGKNPEILAKSKSLQEYSLFIAKVNEELAAGNNLTQAIGAAIKYCVGHNIMANYLTTHETEVRSVLMQKISAREIAEVRFDEGVEIGEVRGEARGIALGEARGEARGKIDQAVNTAIKMIKDNKPTSEIIVYTDLSLNEVLQLRGQYT
ncbi:hypothetical protein FACS1894184_07750 [Clostridia bacterium]|nr:hypothetical protein FACS1894184_07750 [Clostridia bacterium]